MKPESELGELNYDNDSHKKELRVQQLSPTTHPAPTELHLLNVLMLPHKEHSFQQHESLKDTQKLYPHQNIYLKKYP